MVDTSESYKLTQQLASIVISCSEDERIIDTISSIDENVEIIASITPCEKIESLLERRDIRYVITPKGNHSITVNKGVQSASHDKIILIDSDCVFEKGAIRSISEALDTFSVVTERVIFEDTGGFISKQIAACRKFDYTVGFPGYLTYGFPIFRPGLSFHKRLLEKIHYLFNPKIPWTEDADFTYRIQEANIPVQHLSCKVFHRPTTFTSTIFSYHKYGVGDAYRAKYLHQYYHSSLFVQMYERYKTAFKTQCANMIPFLFIFDLAYLFGYMHANWK